MANHASALKRARQDQKKRAQNRAQRSDMRTAVKKLQAAIAAGDKENAQALFKHAVSKIDRAGRKGLIHRNQASRRVSRLNAAVKALA